MSEMIERVAKAICKRRNTKQCASICFSHSSLNESCPEVLTVWKEDAKAAIQAMREPTEEMIDATNKVADGEITETWQTMIDAALKE